MKLNEYQAALSNVQEGLLRCKPCVGSYYLLLSLLNKDDEEKNTALEPLNARIDKRKAPDLHYYTDKDAAVAALRAKSDKRKAQAFHYAIPPENSHDPKINPLKKLHAIQDPQHSSETEIYVFPEFDAQLEKTARLADRCFKKRVPYEQLLK